MELINNKLMKVRVLRTVLVFGCLLATSAGLRAQSGEVSFSKKELTLTEVLSEITWQTQYTLFFNPAWVDLNQLVTLTETKAPLSKILDGLAEKTDYLFQVMDTHIIIIPPTPDEPSLDLVSARRIFRDSGYIPSYDSDGGNNEAFVIEMNYLAERSRNLRGRNSSAIDPSTGSMTDTLWSFIPPAPDRTFTYPDRSMPLEPTGVTSDAGFSSKLPSGALKINLLHGAATLTPNIAYEIGLGPKTSLDVSFSYNPWSRKTDREENKKMIHIIARPEFRYWLCERFNGHFFGAHAFYWRYNVSGHKVPMMFNKDRQYDGNAVGFGVSYGYAWMFAKRWGVEFNAGLGVAFMRHTKKECHLCAPESGKQSKTYFGPTSLGIKLVWTIN